MASFTKLFITSLLTSSVLVGSLSASGEYANPERGQKLFATKIFNECGITCNVMAKNHTQDEWENLHKNNKVMDTLSDKCPIIGEFNKKEVQVIYEYMYEYASDSGKVAACKD